MQTKKKRPGQRTEGNRTSAGKKHNTATDTESKPSRPKRDHKGQGASGGAKERRAKGE